MVAFAFRCPDWAESGTEDAPLMGCGQIVEREPDDEDLVDCPYCGIWFKASEPGVTI